MNSGIEQPAAVQTALPSPLTAAELADVPGVLGDICHERLADYADQAVPELPPENLQLRPSFAAALAQRGLSLIAEVKRSSPSQGKIAELDPVATVQAYARGGARALSILTEPRHFGGELAHLRAVNEITLLPTLRKDFTVHPLQVFEAAEAGASAVLLIVAVLGKHTAGYLRLAKSLGLSALVEVHDERELELAFEAGAGIIGVNNRDLRTLEVDLDNAPRLMARARDTGFEGLLVAESGYRRPEELRRLDGLADAVLVGSSVAASDDLEEAIRHLLAF